MKSFTYRFTLAFVLMAFVMAAKAQPTNGVVLQVPGMNKVVVESGKKFATVNDTTLLFDVTYPAGFNKKTPLPAVVFLSGIGSMDQYSWNIYKDWAKLIAANGLIAINYQTRARKGLEDSGRFMEYLQAHASELAIDKERVGAWACSANVSGGMPLVMGGKGSFIKAFVVYYGNGQAPVMRQDVDILIVRAGLDFLDLNRGIDDFIKKALIADLTFEFINFTEGQHAFDGFDNTPRSKEVVQQTVDFFKRSLSKDHPAAKQVLTTTRLQDMIINQKKVDEALKEWRVAAAAYIKAGHSPFFNHIADERTTNQLGYALLEAGRNEDALKVFMANVDVFPESANVYDGLGDYYEKIGDKAQAVAYSKKALEKLSLQTNLNPSFRDAIKRSAEDKIKRLQ